MPQDAALHMTCCAPMRELNEFSPEFSSQWYHVGRHITRVRFPMYIIFGSHVRARKNYWPSKFRDLAAALMHLKIQFT